MTNEHKWVAVYHKIKNVKTFYKVGRIEYRFALSGVDVNQEFGKDTCDLIAIRIHDRVNHIMNDDGDVINQSLILVDSKTGKPIKKHESLEFEPIPCYDNFIIEGSERTWREEIEHQSLVFLLNDIEWSKFNSEQLVTILNITRSCK